MFDEVFGLPTHVLVVHATVVFVPLAALAAIVYTVVPRWRWASRWPTVVTSVAALIAAVAAAISGTAFFDRLGEPPFLEEHRDRGLLLLALVAALVAVVMTAAVVLGGPTRLVDGQDRDGAARPVQIVTGVVVVVLAVTVLVQVVRTGDSGSRAVWGAESQGWSSEVREASSRR